MKIFTQENSQIGNRNKFIYNTNFRGELEREFFTAIRNGKIKDSAKVLNDLKFDVFEKDAITGNTFLHIVCIENIKDLYNKASKLLKINKDRLSELLNITNKDNKKALDYLVDNEFRFTINSLLGDDLGESIDNTVGDNINDTNFDNGNQKEFVNEPGVNKQKVGNEVEDDIDVGDFDFDDEVINPPNTSTAKEAESITLKGFDGIVGNSNLINLFKKEIIAPLNNKKNVFINGLLIHGLSGTGKTYSIEKLAEELDKEIMFSSEFLSKELNGKELANTIEKNIIRINPDDLNDIVNVTDILKRNYKETHKQGFIFIDEIQKVFPLDSRYLNNIRAIQALENSARNGIVLLATTQSIENIDQNLLNSLRFEKVVELKLPTSKDIKKLLDNELSIKLTDDEINKLTKTLNGFSHSDIVRIVNATQFHNENPNFSDYEKQIKEYAEEHLILGLSEEGTTSAYDTFLKRSVLSLNDPKSFDDVAGMVEVKEKLKKVFNPLKKMNILEEFYAENKVKKPNGVLLYGPPGCGKTFVMTALAAEMKLPMYQVKLSDVTSALVGEAEKNITKVFNQLRKKYKETKEPSILFFDECDSLFKKNSSNSLDNTAILNTLKEEMNNAGDDGIYVVAATNEKDNLNTAIIRDGRFDTKIEVGYPDEPARMALISKALNIPLLVKNKIDSNIKLLADMTKGFSNVTIARVISNLVYERTGVLSENVNSKEELQKTIKENPIDIKELEESFKLKREEINKTKLKYKDKTGLEWQEKTSSYDEFLDRTYASESSPKSLKDVIGMDDVKKQITFKVIAPLNPLIKKIYDKEKIPMGGGILLHGPGGVGKTFIMQAAAAEAKVPLYELKLSETGSSFMNETANKIKNIFNQLKRKYKETGEASILFLDECDSLLGKISSTGSDVGADRANVLNTLKQELATAQENGIIVVAATNDYDKLDHNVIRSGRFNSHIKIGYPDSKAREAYLKHLLSKRESTKDLLQNEDFSKIIEITEGMSNADMKTFVEDAVIESKEEIILKIHNLENVSDIEKVNTTELKKVTFEDLLNAAKTKKIEVDIQRGDYENSIY